MLWFPQRKYGDFSLKLQWRDDAPGTGNANSGVFVRFPWVHDHPEESRPEWVAIKYGHEVQVLDRPDGDMYKTGFGLRLRPGGARRCRRHPEGHLERLRDPGGRTSTTRSTATAC